MTARSQQTVPMSDVDVTHPSSLSALRNLKLFVSSYLGLSVVTLVAIILLRNNASVVNAAVWIRGTIVVASALLTFVFARRAARGHRKAFLRVRIISVIMVVAIVTIISLPGTFPLWMKIEQGICGLLLLGVVVISNGKNLRSVFAAK